MEFEWDESKRPSNIDKHGVHFQRAREIFDGRPRVDIESQRGDEHRFLSVSILDEAMVAVAWTQRPEDVVRLTSVRRARRGEGRQYRQVYG
jgi:uncharacterized protein